MKNKRPDDLRALVLQHLHVLRVPMAEEQLAATLEEGEKAGWSHLQLLERLLSGPAETRRVNRIQRRIQEARFAEEISGTS